MKHVPSLGAKRVAAEYEYRQRMDPNLTLDGLRLIWERNQHA